MLTQKVRLLPVHRGLNAFKTSFKLFSLMRQIVLCMSWAKIFRIVMLSGSPGKIVCCSRYIHGCCFAAKYIDDKSHFSKEMAPGEGFEPPTGWLTATCSAS